MTRFTITACFPTVWRMHFKLGKDGQAAAYRRYSYVVMPSARG